MKKSIRTLVFAAFLCALEIVLNRFCSFNTMGLKVGVSFIPCIVAAILFGPLAAAAVWGMGDFLGAILFPIGPYHPGFTLCAAMMGLCSGLFLYCNPFGRRLPQWKEIRLFPNVVLPVLVNNLLFGLCLNTLWISQLYSGKTYWGFFVSRLLTEYSVLIPLQLILIPLLLRLERPLRKIVNSHSAYQISATKR